MKPLRAIVMVSQDPASLERGGGEVYRSFQRELQAFGLSDQVALTGIYDLPDRSDLPLVMIYPDAAIYGPLLPEDVHALVDGYLYRGQLVKSLLPKMREPTGDLEWLRRRQGALPVQRRIVLQRVGKVDPLSLQDYLLNDGYTALGQVLTSMTPQQVIDEIDHSGLQGRGGAGFPTGRKWSFVAGAAGSPKYVVCNADESEPGTFKDRLVLEGDPYSVVEAMTIAGYAVGANEGYIYIRGEYRLAYQRLEHAIAQAGAAGLLGVDIFGSGFNFHIHLHAGAGAYICGEETALIESIEGKRGQPRARPPYPPTCGLWCQPTLVNNVETLVNVPAILRNGAEWYHRFGTPNSAGTKVYQLMGRTNFTGVIEVPLGITLRELIDVYGKGMRAGAKLKLVQTGGSSGSIVPAVLQDTPMDFNSFRAAGVSLGSGSLLVCDEQTCVIDLALAILNFFRFECCAKCTPCRTGTQRLYQIVERIAQGGGRMEDLDEIEQFGGYMEMISNCGLGQTASTAIRDILRRFRPEVEAHIIDKTCPAGVCAIHSGGQC